MELQVTYFHQPGNVEEGEVEEVSSCLDCCCWGQLCAHNSGNGSCRGLSSSGLTNQYSGLTHCTYQWCIPSETDSLKVQKQNRELQEYNQSEGCFFDLYKSPRKTQVFCGTARTKKNNNRFTTTTFTGLVLANNPVCKDTEATMEHIPFR